MTPQTAVTARDTHDGLVLDQIRETWDALYACDHADGAYCAHRLTGGPLLTTATPGDLAAAIWADWSSLSRDDAAAGSSQ